MTGPGTPAPPLPPDRLLDLYYYMRLTRSLEERLVALKHQGRIPCGIYRSLGQEAGAVGAAAALEPGDVLGPLIRDLGAILVRGAAPLDVLRNMMGTAASPTRGRELGFHFSDLERGFIGHVSVLGDMVAVLAGVALSFKLRGERRVALVFSGDGATSTGTFHEGLNLAAVRRVPLVVVVESNRYAYSTPSRRQFAIPTLTARAAAYGIPAVRVDGNDVVAVYQATREAANHARAGEGVTLVELETYRRTGHALHDDQRYVPAGEVDRWASANDPLDRCRAALLAAGSPGDRLHRMDARVVRELEAALAACAGDPPPAGESALEGVYLAG